MSAVLDHHDHAHDDHHHAPTGWQRWVYATNHKDIGTLYLLFSFTMLIVGGILALLIRAELFQPGLQLVNPELFNSLTTMHGLIMVFGAIMPGQKLPFGLTPTSEGARGSDIIIEGITEEIIVRLDGFRQS